MVLSQSLDVDSLFHIEQGSVRQSYQTCWHQVVTSVCAVAILGVIYVSLRSPLRNLATRCSSPNTVHEPSTTAQNPSPLPPEPRRREYTPTNDNSQKDVAFNEPTKLHWDTSWNNFVSATALQPANFIPVPSYSVSRRQQLYASAPDEIRRQPPR